MSQPNDPRLQNFSIFGLAAVEIDIDVLTGIKWIVRADIFEDVGRSINPAIDVGQVRIYFPHLHRVLCLINN